jgi:hypothetical protein
MLIRIISFLHPTAHCHFTSVQLKFIFGHKRCTYVKGLKATGLDRLREYMNSLCGIQKSRDQISNSGLKQHEVLTALLRVRSSHYYLERKMSLRHASEYYFSTVDGNERVQ